MTKVEMRLEVQRPLDETMMTRISEAHAIYGMISVKVLPGTADLLVEYDASRLSATDVKSALSKGGIPVRPVST